MTGLRFFCYQHWQWHKPLMVLYNVVVTDGLILMRTAHPTMWFFWEFWVRHGWWVVANYRRANAPGGTYFFTVVTFRRRRVLCDDDVRLALRMGIKQTRLRYPFEIDAWVLLPDHLHCIWTLPDGDADFGKRWSMIKRYVTQHCPRLKRDDWMNDSKRKRMESTLWQRRFWEHQIRDERDYENHVNYIHFNPVKHGHVERVGNWPYSTFHKYEKRGVYEKHWCGINENDAQKYGEPLD